VVLQRRRKKRGTNDKRSGKDKHAGSKVELSAKQKDQPEEGPTKEHRETRWKGKTSCKRKGRTIPHLPAEKTRGKNRGSRPWGKGGHAT